MIKIKRLKHSKKSIRQINLNILVFKYKRLIIMEKIYDTLQMAKGLFLGISPFDQNEIIRGEFKFYVEATFPLYLLLATVHHQIKDLLHQGKALETLTLKHFSYQSLINQATKMGVNINQLSRQGVKLYLPTPEIALESQLDEAIGLGVVHHELGHLLYDKANELFTKEHVKLILGKLLNLIKNVGYESKSVMSITCTSENEKQSELRHIPRIDAIFHGLNRWVNICMDIRIEHLLKLQYASSKNRLESLQSYIFQIEDVYLSESKFGTMIGLIMRDLGKNHQTPSLKTRIQFYQSHFPYAFELSQKMIHLIAPLQLNSLQIDETLHLPLLQSIEMISLLDQDRLKLIQNKLTTNELDLIKKEQGSCRYFRKNQIQAFEIAIFGQFKSVDATETVSQNIQSRKDPEKT